MFEPESAAPGATPGDPKGQGETVTMTKAELGALTRDRDEARQSEKAWADHFRAGNAPRAAVEPIVEALPTAAEFPDPEGIEAAGLEDDTPEKMVDDLAAHGVAALSKRGFITAADALKIAKDVAITVAGKMIDGKVARMGTDQQILGQYPDLRNQNSELFKETGEIYREAIALDPNATKSPVALFLAAKAASANIKARAQVAAPRRAADDETADDRTARIMAQGGRGSAAVVEDDDSLVGDDARTIMKAMGISDAEFKASQKAVSATRSKGRR